MKVLVFAHVPPPHHGQSYMVKLMLDGFGGDWRRRPQGSLAAAGDVHGIACYHVNTQLSRGLEDIGERRVGKALRLLLFCCEAVWCRFRHGVPNFYFVPGPGKSSALYRDWLVMLLCRPFFKRLILHWHAAGLGHWLEASVPWTARALTYRLGGRPDLSIVLSRYNHKDAERFQAKRISVVDNGIPDPCADFEAALLPRRRSRFAVRRTCQGGGHPTAAELQAAGEDPLTVRVLFLALCMEEKGVFDVVNAVRLANRILGEKASALRLKLQVAGAFVTAEDRARFEASIADPEMKPFVAFLGFLSGEAKALAFQQADLFCFPTYYLGENQPVSLLEAMAYGLPIVTTRWRSLPEMFPADHPGIVPIRSPESIATSLLELMGSESGERSREWFLARFKLEVHLAKLAAALRSVETDDRLPQPPEGKRP